jgi:hypothetical protein
MAPCPRSSPPTRLTREGPTKYPDLAPEIEPHPGMLAGSVPRLRAPALPSMAPLDPDELGRTSCLGLAVRLWEQLGVRD